MDDLVSVREVAADTPPLTANARAAARDRLRVAITAESRRPVSTLLPRRTALRVAFAATVAVGVGGAAVVAAERGGTTRSPRMETLSAAQVLHKAAGRTRSGGTELPIPRDDQYIYSKTFTTHTPLKGGKTTTWTDESWLSVDGSKPSRREELGKVHIDPPLGKHEVPSFPTEYAALKKWPTDPDELLKWLGQGSTVTVVTPKGSSGPAPTVDPDEVVYSSACELMKGPRVMPPGLQAAAFEALAKLPRIKLDHDGVDALGRHGIGVSYPNVSFSLVFDRSTYDYLGMRQTGSHAEHTGGTWKQVGWYTEITAQEKVGVVDRIGQRP
jgi:hypothetical protein